jgi:MerR family mercuric resistance operon transcriptional regulator
LALDSTEDREAARKLALGRVAALDEQIARLEGARDALKRLAGDCASGGPGGCPILQAFER